MQYYYPWRHKKPMTEPIVSKKYLVDYLSSYGWCLKNTYTPENYYYEDSYRELSNSITKWYSQK